MIHTRTAPYGVFLLRLALALLFFAHAGLKISSSPLPGRRSSLAPSGCRPRSPISPSLGSSGAVALVVGLWPRLARCDGSVILLGAIFAVHIHAGFFFTSPNGGWQFPALWIVGLLTVALVGDGAFTLVPTPVPGSVDADRRVPRAA